MPKVTANWLREFQMQINDGRHQWMADVSTAAGGSDVEPGPFDMLCAALAACKCFVVKKYAVNSKLPVEDVIVEVNGSFRDENDLGSFEMKAEVKVKGDLSEKDLQRLLRAAQACPVKQAIIGVKEVKTTVARI